MVNGKHLSLDTNRLNGDLGRMVAPGPGGLREAVRLCARLLEHNAYRDRVEERLQPTDEELASADALDNWMRERVSTSQQISGTCKMGPASEA